jgi:hypothetical protein
MSRALLGYVDVSCPCFPREAGTVTAWHAPKSRSGRDTVSAVAALSTMRCRLHAHRSKEESLSPQLAPDVPRHKSVSRHRMPLSGKHDSP